MLVSWIVTLIIGAIVGYIASHLMHTRESLLVEIVIGIVGAILGKFLFADVLGIGGAVAAGSFSIAGVLWGVVGSVILIALLRAFGLIGTNHTA